MAKKNKNQKKKKRKKNPEWNIPFTVMDWLMLFHLCTYRVMSRGRNTVGGQFLDIWVLTSRNLLKLKTQKGKGFSLEKKLWVISARNVIIFYVVFFFEWNADIKRINELNSKEKLFNVKGGRHNGANALNIIGTTVFNLRSLLCTSKRFLQEKGTDDNLHIIYKRLRPFI